MNFCYDSANARIRLLLAGSTLGVRSPPTRSTLCFDFIRYSRYRRRAQARSNVRCQQVRNHLRLHIVYTAETIEIEPSRLACGAGGRSSNAEARLRFRAEDVAPVAPNVSSPHPKPRLPRMQSIGQPVARMMRRFSESFSLVVLRCH